MAGKRFITHGSVAGVITVFAVTDPEAPRHGRFSCFAVRGTDAGLLGLPPGAQARHPRQPRRPSSPSREFASPREPHRRGGRRLETRDGDLRPVATRDRCAGGRHRPGRARRRRRLRPRSEAVRAADRRAPDGPGDARGHGREGRGCAPAHVQGRPSRSRPARGTPPAGRRSPSSWPATRRWP